MTLRIVGQAGQLLGLLELSVSVRVADLELLRRLGVARVEPMHRECR